MLSFNCALDVERVFKTEMKGKVKLFLALLLLFFNCFQVQKAASCGQKFTGAGNIFGGSKAASNAWPWLTVFLNKPINYFFCGGSLISVKTVVSGKK